MSMKGAMSTHQLTTRSTTLYYLVSLCSYRLRVELHKSTWYVRQTTVDMVPFVRVFATVQRTGVQYRHVQYARTVPTVTRTVHCAPVLCFPLTVHPYCT